MPLCEAVQTCRSTQEQRTCGKPATHQAYGSICFCADCLHECMQDASPDEQATIIELTPGQRSKRP